MLVRFFFFSNQRRAVKDRIKTHRCNTFQACSWSKWFGKKKWQRLESCSREFHASSVSFLSFFMYLCSCFFVCVFFFSFFTSVQFISVSWLIGSSVGRDRQFSRDSLPACCTAGGHCEQFWHGQGCPIFDFVPPAFPLPTIALPTLQGALKRQFLKRLSW